MRSHERIFTMGMALAFAATAQGVTEGFRKKPSLKPYSYTVVELFGRCTKAE